MVPRSAFSYRSCFKDDTETRYVNRNNPGTIYQSKTLKYFIAGPTFAYKSKMPKQLRDKCFFPKNFVVNETTSNQPHDSFCKILNMSQGLKDAFNTFSFTNNFMYWYVNSFGDRSSDVLCCPDFVMRGLGMKIGSVMGVEEIKHTQDLLNEMKFYKDKERNIEEPVFPAGIEKIYKKVIKTVGDNMRCNQKINILIIGSAGMGKTFLLNSLANHFNEVFLHCVKIDCKSLRKLKVSDISKIFSKKLSECCKYQPSVLLIDDLDAFIIEATEGDHYSSMYREYIGNSIISLLSSYQKVNDIHFIATGSYPSKFKTISTDHGPLIFQSIHEIMELDPEERSFMLKHLISKEYPKYKVDDNTFIDDIKDRMKSYNIQDLCDFLDIVVLNCHSRTDTDKTKLIKSDFEAALSEKVPLSLYGVNLHNSPATRWEDIGGMEETKEMLNEMFSWPLKYQEVYKSCPLRLQCGVLLYGAPGTGKTLIAGAVASECGLNFISIKGPEILSKYVGASEQGIRDLFLRAKKAKPCLLFFDEFDSLASRRGSSNTDVNDRVVNQLLTELDGVEELTGVYILGATSRPDLLDPALLRPGRIDKTVYCTLPNEKERSSILRALSKRLKSADDIDLESIASKTDGYTGADLQAILYAAQSAMVKEAEKDRNGSDQKLILKQSHLLTGLAEIKPSLSDEDQLKYNMIYDNFTQCRTGGVVKQPQDTQMKVMYA
ncbi:UNVERIFIED_CONTAM: hypothetical protein PYX00_006690 [Menopon gallinae]|uniref:Peroxisomal ATPase PEX1 n=1 Tax=Menopon gallinae TaxID=328185 RepID=A0AAW2HX63_9NEOP